MSEPLTEEQVDVVDFRQKALPILPFDPITPETDDEKSNSPAHKKRTFPLPKRPRPHPPHTNTSSKLSPPPLHNHSSPRRSRNNFLSPKEQLEMTEFYNRKKHIFIVTWGGRPLYTRYGSLTAKHMTSFMGVVTLLPSSVANVGGEKEKEDKLIAFTSSDCKFLYLLRGPLYYFMISKNSQQSIRQLKNELKYESFFFLFFSTPFPLFFKLRIYCTYLPKKRGKREKGEKENKCKMVSYIHHQVIGPMRVLRASA